MHTSKTGLNLIKEFEGCYLNSYKCPAGVWTIGYGTTEPINGKPIGPGMTITQKQADELLLKNLKSYESAVNKYVTYAINQNQFDALTSFTYNCGSGALQKSDLLKKLNNGDVAGAADQFDLWVNGGGKKLPGLVRRREAEKKLFLTPIKVVDEEYKKAVTKLAQEFNINDASWYPEPNPKNLQALVQKIGRKWYGINDYKFIVHRMYQDKVISNTELWLSHEYNTGHIKSLIKKIAARLG